MMGDVAQACWIDRAEDVRFSNRPFEVKHFQTIPQRLGLVRPFGSPGFAPPGRPVLHRRLILSRNSAGKVGDYVIDSLPGLRC
jgi:hypothetical protein